MGEAIKKRAPWLNEKSTDESFVIGHHRYTLKMTKGGEPVYKRVDLIHQIEETKTNYLHYITSNSNYEPGYLRSISVVEFFAIVGRIKKDIRRKTKALENK